jgi:sulfite reductase (ferredoxin)
MTPFFAGKPIKVEDQKDILELERRIDDFRTGKEDVERFRLYRLTRGVYGQRQFGVQMFRIKIPFGKVTAEQLIRIADVSEKYTNGNLHITTRQNIQLHFVKLEDSPAVWADLAEKNITAREACGNTVRNITGSAKAGIDPNEPFDISPYVQGAFEYFLRNPICQDMGRKIKIAFSSSEQDSAATYFHDFGFIPRIQLENGETKRGFKVVLGGGLGAVSIVASTVYEFLPETEIIPFMEAGLRVFDRYGEREKRMKARMKFLVQKLGVEGFMELVETERIAIKNKSVAIDWQDAIWTEIPTVEVAPAVAPLDEQKYQTWFHTNVFPQKQEGFVGVQLRVELGNIHAEEARALAALVKLYAADDIRFTLNQGILLRYVRLESLPYLFNELLKLGLAEPGFDTIADVTACPGSDTCALAVTNSTGLAKKLEEVIRTDYPELIAETNIKIKISGCMNACGQHMAANIGFHGSSIKKGNLVVPAMQVVLGGGIDPQGKGFIADKIIKIPTKRVPSAVSILLDDYESLQQQGEYFNDYFYRLGEKHFYNLLKPLAAVDNLQETDLFDWGQDYQYRQEIGVGECAAVMLDVVGMIVQDAYNKVLLAKEAVTAGVYADGIYHAYTAFVIGAKAMLLSKDMKCNTQKGIIDDFQTYYIQTGDFGWSLDFSDYVLRINQQEPSQAFATLYCEDAHQFIQKVIDIRKIQLLETNGMDKEVIADYYKA